MRIPANLVTRQWGSHGVDLDTRSPNTRFIRDSMAHNSKMLPKLGRTRWRASLDFTFHNRQSSPCTRRSFGTRGAVWACADELSSSEGGDSCAIDEANCPSSESEAEPPTELECMEAYCIGGGASSWLSSSGCSMHTTGGLATQSPAACASIGERPNRAGIRVALWRSWGFMGSERETCGSPAPAPCAPPLRAGSGPPLPPAPRRCPPRATRPECRPGADPL